MTSQPGTVPETILDVESSQHALISKPVRISGVPPPPPKDLYKEPLPKEKDRLVNELDAPAGFPSWVRNLLFFVLGTPVLLLPAILIHFTNPKTEYWGLTPASPLKGGIFSASLLSGIYFGFYMGTLTIISFLPFLIRNLESASNTRMLGARTRSAFKHFLMIRSGCARFLAILPTWTLSQFFVVLPSWAPQLFTVALLFSFLLFVKDIFIQRVSIKYHTTYHEKRININKMALKCMKKLRKQYIPHYRHSRFSSDRPGSPDSFDEAVDEFHLDSKSISHAKIEEMSGMLFKEISNEAGKSELKPEDLFAVLGKAEAEEFFKYLDTDGNGDLTRKEFILGISGVYADRDLLQKTLAESDDVLQRLDLFVANAVMLLGAMISFNIFDISSAVSAVLSTQIFLILCFFFNDMITEAFVSIVFVFLTHPFDTGDNVIVDGTSYVVRKIGLWYSSFYGAGRRLVYIRNSQLCNSVIMNINRSGPMSEEINMVVDIKTTAKQLLSLEERMSKFLRANCRDYEGITYIKNIKLPNSEAVVIQLEIRHKSNFSDNAVRHRRSLLLMNFFKDSLQLLDIKLAPYSYDLPITPTLVT